MAQGNSLLSISLIYLALQSRISSIYVKISVILSITNDL